MDRTTKKVFKCIYNNKNIKCKADLQKKFPNIPNHLINQACDTLYNEQLIKWSPDGMHLTNKSSDYFYNKRVNFVKYILKSIIVPTIVSVITSLVTLWLSGVFPTKQ